MSRVDILNQAIEEVEVKFLEFTRLATPGKYVMFFEGEDEKYYSGRISNIAFGIKWDGVICNGKSKLLKLHTNIINNSVYSDAKCMFFVDADFDDNTNLKQFKNIYVTPCYSIENLYCSSEVFHKILSAEFKINESNEACYEKVLQAFNKTKNDFLEAIAPFNYFIKQAKNSRKADGNKVKLNLNNIQFDKLVEVELGQVRKLYDENDYNTIIPDLKSNEDIEAIRAVDLTTSKEYFKSRDPHLWFRGKQNLEFLRVFLGKLKEDCGKKGKRQIFKDKKPISLQLTKTNCISELSQYAETPECLREFILANC